MDTVKATVKAVTKAAITGLVKNLAVGMAVFWASVGVAHVTGWGLVYPENWVWVVAIVGGDMALRLVIVGVFAIQAERDTRRVGELIRRLDRAFGNGEESSK